MMLRFGLFIFMGLTLALTDLMGLSAEASSPYQFKKVVVIIFENENFSDVLGQHFFADLAKRGALLTDFMAETHPSQPNYIALVAGDTLGVRSDNNVDLRQNHLGDLLELEIGTLNRQDSSASPIMDIWK